MKLPLLSVYDFHERAVVPAHAKSAEHIRTCQELRNVPGCGECGLYESCEVIKAHLRSITGYDDGGSDGAGEI